jgi:hypothetical protein
VNCHPQKLVTNCGLFLNQKHTFPLTS